MTYIFHVPVIFHLLFFALKNILVLLAKLNSGKLRCPVTALIEIYLYESWDGGTEVCSNGHGHMTKMATMAIYGKNLKKSSSLEPKGQWPWILVCIIGCLSTTKVAQMMTLGWLWPILRQGQILSHMLLYGKKVKHGFFRNYCRLWLETGNRWPK